MSGDIRAVRVRFDKTDGRINPVNGMCNCPMSPSADLTEDFKILMPPVVRFHQSGGSQSKFYIDISNIFPDSDRNENDPESYNFKYSDKLIEAAHSIGAEIIYRLGESYDRSGISKFSRPPRNYDKWASICLHIVMHYNGGWADGYNFGIRFWEIWSRPDAPLVDGVSPTWADGTDKQAFRLYEATARAIKEYDSDLCVGGMSFCGYGNYAVNFIAFCAERRVPLDFLSYCCYTSEPHDFEVSGRAFRELLNLHGFNSTALAVSEWNYLGFERECEIRPIEIFHDKTSKYSTLRAEMSEARQGIVGAAFCAAAMICMDRADIDIATYYDAQPNSVEFCGLFGAYLEKRKPFYAFSAFSHIYSASERADCHTIGNGIYATAAGDGERFGILAVSYRGGGAELFCEGLGRDRVHKIRVFSLDGTKNNELISEQVSVGDKLHLSLGLGKYSIVYIDIN